MSNEAILVQNFTGDLHTVMATGGAVLEAVILFGSVRVRQILHKKIKK